MKNIQSKVFQDLILYIEKEFGTKKKNAIWGGNEREGCLQN